MANVAVPIGHIDELGSMVMKMVKVDGHRLCVVRTSDGVFALDQACPHEGYGLTTGELAEHPQHGAVITCAWHNWKFKVADGSCVLGEEDVRTHSVDVAVDGTMSVTLSQPDPMAARPKLLESLRSGLERNYVGQMSRDVVRLLRADTNPGELMWEGVAYGAPRSEFGWGHSVASLTDCLSMIDHYVDDDRALPIVQALAGVAESERGRLVNPVADPATDLPSEPGTARTMFRAAVEAEDLDRAQAMLRAALMNDAARSDMVPWLTDVVSDHHLSYGHGAIYVQKAFQLLDRLGWDRADTVLPYLLPTLVYGTREDKLPYMKLFHRGVEQLDLTELALAASEPRVSWEDDGRLATALLGDDRTEAAKAVGAALSAGAGLDGVLDSVSLAVSERMLRYDPAGEFDFHDDFGWLDITHGLTYSNAARWHVDQALRAGGAVTPDLVRLVLWVAFQANWTGRHEWHTAVGRRAEIDEATIELSEYGAQLQHEALLDGTTAFIVHAHAVKMSVAATDEAIRLRSSIPLDATARFMSAPKLERFVASTVTRSIDFLSGRTLRD
ncbi:MAG TPA: Rieske 2Fe-2S domain-containing protein [Ilumatobacter sp.]|nr:Rieske 2Fe-2S domain-containing protein [Ilumatobacter sp.]